MTNAADIIKARYTMEQVLAMLGLETDKKGFMCCPFHGEKTASCRIYPTSFYCFGCGEGGDIITFVSKYLDKDFRSAVAYLGGDDISFSERRQIEERKRRIEREAKRRQRVKDNYINLLCQCATFDAALIKYRPKTQGEPLHPEFVKALKNIDRIKYELDCAAME